MRVDNRGRLYPNRLQMFRKSAGLKQWHVATLLGLNNPTTISEWENERQMPSSTNLIKLCIIYNATPKEMYPEYFQLMIRYLNANK